MDLPPIVRQLNWVDWLVLAVLLYFARSGMSRGLLLGVLDLVGIVVTLGVAIVGYQPLAALVMRHVEASRSLVTLGSFLGLVILAQAVYGAAVSWVFRISRPVWKALTPLGFFDRVLGMIPGAVKGLAVAGIALLPFALFPLVPSVSAGIETSTIGSRLVGVVVERAPDFDRLLGRDLAEGLAFLTPPQTDEGRKLNFGALGQLTPDPQAEERMLELVNQERTRAGLRALRADEELRQVARAHSREMFEQGYFAHNSPVTGTPFDRMRRAGIRFIVAGENLAYAPSVQVAHEGLMRSPGHRANILRAEFGRVGIGVIRSDLRGSMFSQEFAN